MAEETLIYKADVTQALAGLDALLQRVTELKEEQKKYDDQIKEGQPLSKEQRGEYEKNAAQIKVLNTEIKNYRKSLEDSAKAGMYANGEIAEYGDSLVELRKQLSLLTRAYDSLSKADREGLAGENLKTKINDITKVIKEAESGTQRFYRNVGNYPKVFEIAGGSIDKLTTSLGGISKLGGTVGNSLGVATKAVKGLGTAFITPPMAAVNAIITVLSLVVQKLTDAFKNNDDAGTALQSAFAAFQPIITVINKLFTKFAEILGKLIEGWATAISAIGSFIGKMIGLKNATNDAAKASQDLIYMQDKLEDAEREYTVNSAKREKEIQRLKTESRKTNKYEAAERLAMMKQAAALEKQDLDEKLKIAKERWEIAQKDAAQNVKTSDEQKNKLAELEAAMHRAEAEHYAGLQRLTMQTVTAEKEIAKERADATAKVLAAQKEKLEQEEKLLKAAEEKKRKEIENDNKILQDLENARIEDIQDKYAREYEVFKATQIKKINDLKNTATYSEKAEQARIAQIERLEKQLEQKRKELIKKKKEEEIKAAKQAADSTLQKEIERLDLLLNTVKKNSDKELQIKLARIDAEQERELLAKADTEEKKNAIIAKYNLQRFETEKQFNQNAYNEQVKIIEDTMFFAQNQAGVNRIKAAQLAADAEKDKLNLMKNLNSDAIQYMYGSMEEYNKALINQTNKTKTAIDEIKEQQKAAMETQLQAMQGFGNALADVFNELGDDSEEWAAYLYALSVAQIAMDTALAISSATSASTAGDPYTVAFRIAAAVTAAVAAMAAATKELNKAKIPTAPKFAKGGKVVGAGNSTSDSILAYLSNGESVINARATAQFAPLLSAINQSTGGNIIKSAGGATGTGYSVNSMAKEIGREVGKKIEQMPAPVVSVVEITEQQNRVSFLNQL